MPTYKPKTTNDIVVKFNREQLEDLMERLDQSGADEIGIELEECRK